MKKRKMKKKIQEKRKTAKATPEDRRRQFAHHLQELRRRLLFVAVTVLVFSTAAYFVQQSLVSFLLKPAHNQHFIYTSPGGGIGFLFQVCSYVGIIASIPILIYQALRFIEPVIGDNKRLLVIKMSCMSAVLAALGFSFGYLIGLPAALHFLSHQFTTTQIQPLLTIQEYMSFVTVYLIGSALIFQLPLIVVFINRIKPLKPSQLFGFERYVIAGAFIVSMLMAPTVNLIDQLVLAGPIIVIYQLAIAVVLLNNRGRRTTKVDDLIEQDQALQAARQAKNLLPVSSHPVNAPAPLPRGTYLDSASRPINRKPQVQPLRCYRPGMDFDFIRPIRREA
jgi:sec-independent protein translocase protein TatC